MRRACLCGCGALVPPPKRKGRPKRFFNQRCAERAFQRTPACRKVKRAAKRRYFREVLGRSCKWCQARDDEVPFDGVSVCAACRRSCERQACPKCGGPRNQRPFYCPCSPPSYMEPVILLDEGSDRERTIYRTLLRERSTYKAWVSVANAYHRYEPGTPLVLTLPTKAWLRTKR